MLSFLLLHKHLITRKRSLVIVDVSLIYGADLKKSLLGRPLVMRGCALLRLPDQKTMTGLRKGLRKQLLICEYGFRKLWPNDTAHVSSESAVDDQVP